jgi:hypothetical protein
LYESSIGVWGFAQTPQAGYNGFISFLQGKKLMAQKWQGGRTKNPVGFWFSEFCKAKLPRRKPQAFA